jgi:hypothetical protein
MSDQSIESQQLLKLLKERVDRHLKVLNHTNTDLVTFIGSKDTSQFGPTALSKVREYTAAVIQVRNLKESLDLIVQGEEGEVDTVEYKPSFLKESPVTFKKQPSGAYKAEQTAPLEDQVQELRKQLIAISNHLNTSVKSDLEALDIKLNTGLNHLSDRVSILEDVIQNIEQEEQGWEDQS